MITQTIVIRVYYDRNTRLLYLDGNRKPYPSNSFVVPAYLTSGTLSFENSMNTQDNCPKVVKVQEKGTSMTILTASINTD